VIDYFDVVNCWPTPTQDGFDVNIEYELIKSDLELEDVIVRIPHPYVLISSVQHHNV